MYIYMQMEIKPKGPQAARLRQRKFALSRRFQIPADLLPGSLSQTARRCGKPTCHCATGEGHPIWYLTFMVAGQKRVERIPDAWVEDVRRRVEAGREFKQALAEVMAAKRASQTAPRSITPVLPPSDHEDALRNIPAKTGASFRKFRWAAGILAVLALFSGAYLLGRMGARDYVDRARTAGDDSRRAAEIPDGSSVFDANPGIKGALVIVDGRPAGFTPLHAPVTIGEKKKKPVVVSLPGRVTFRWDVTFKPGAEKKSPRKIHLTPRLAPLPPTDDALTVAGRRVMPGESPLLPAGLYRATSDTGTVRYIRVE